MAKIIAEMGIRLKEMILRMLSLKFFFTGIHVFLGIVFMVFMIRQKNTDAALWGVWSGYMSLGLGIYTAGNVESKKYFAKGDTP